MRRYALTIFISVAVSIVFQGVAFCEVSQRDIDALSKASLIYIATVRKDGNQSKPAPVWFTTSADHAVIIQTSPDSWKAKRIKRGSPAIVWIGKGDGPAFIGKAEITSGPEAVNRLIEDYPKKYWMAWAGAFRPSKEKIESGKTVAIKIVPVQDLPEGFASQPGTPAPKLEAAGH
jgi:hypothetical protein